MADENKNTDYAVKIVTSYDGNGFESFKKDLQRADTHVNSIGKALDGVLDKQIKLFSKSLNNTFTEQLDEYRTELTRFANPTVRSGLRDTGESLDSVSNAVENLGRSGSKLDQLLSQLRSIQQYGLDLNRIYGSLSNVISNISVSNGKVSSRPTPLTSITGASANAMSDMYKQADDEVLTMQNDVAELQQLMTKLTGSHFSSTMKSEFELLDKEFKALDKSSTDLWNKIHLFEEVNEVSVNGLLGNDVKDLADTENALDDHRKSIEHIIQRWNVLEQQRKTILEPYETQLKQLMTPMDSKYGNRRAELSVEYQEAVKNGDVLSANSARNKLKQNAIEVETLTYKLKNLADEDRTYGAIVSEQAEKRDRFNQLLKETTGLIVKLNGMDLHINDSFSSGLYTSSKEASKQLEDVYKQSFSDGIPFLDDKEAEDYFANLSTREKSVLDDIKVNSIDATRSLSSLMDALQTVSNLASPQYDTGKFNTDILPKTTDLKSVGNDITSLIDKLKTSTSLSLNYIGGELSAYVSRYQEWVSKYKGAMSSLSEASKGFDKTKSAYAKNTDDIKQQENVLNSLLSRLNAVNDAYNNDRMSSDEYEKESSKLSAQVDKETEALGRLLAKRSELRKEYDSYYNAMEKAYASSVNGSNMINTYSANISRISSNGKNELENNKKDANAQKLYDKTLQQSMKDAEKERKKFVENFTKGFSSVMKYVGNMASSFVSNIGSMTKAMTSFVTKGVVRFTKAFAKLGKSIITAPFRSIGNVFKQINSYLKMLETRIKRRVVAEMFKDLTGNLGAMAEQRESFNSSMSSMMIALEKFGAQIIAVAQPIMEMFAPALEMMARTLTTVATYLSQFTAVLNAQGYFFKATDGAYDFADAMKNASESTNGATKSAKEYENTVMGFDQLNKLNGTKNGSSGSRGNYAQELNEANALNDLAKKLRDAFMSRDWKGVGNALADIVNAGSKWLDGMLGWSNKADKIKAFAKGFVDTINGFFDGLDSKTIGFAIGDIMNSVIEFTKMVTDPSNGIDFRLIGQRIGETIVEAMKTINWYDAGMAFVQSIQGFINVINGIISTPEFWKTLGVSFNLGLQGMVDAFSPDDWSDLISGLVNGFAEFLVNAFSNDSGVFTNLGTKIGKALSKTFSKLDGKKLATGINSFNKAIIEVFRSAFNNLDGDTIIGFFTDFFTNLDWGSALTVIIGASLVKLPSLLLGSLGSMLPTLGQGIVTLVEACISNPVALAVMAGLALIGVAVATHFEELQPHFELFGQNLVSGWDKLAEHFEKLKPYIDDIKEALTPLMDNVAQFIAYLLDALGTLWDVVLAPLLGKIIDGLAPDILTAFDSIINGLSGLLEMFAGVFEAISGLFTGDWDTLWDGCKKAIHGFASFMRNTFVALLSIIQAPFNLLIEGLNSISVDIPDWVPVVGGKTFGINIPKLNIDAIIPEVPKFAKGGSAYDGQLFIANENGAELIARGDGGRTTITNNEQIVGAITNGVRSAMIDVMSRYNRQDNNNNGDIVIMVDSEELARASLRGQRNLDKRMNPTMQFAY